MGGIKLDCLNDVFFSCEYVGVSVSLISILSNINFVSDSLCGKV